MKQLGLPMAALRGMAVEVEVVVLQHVVATNVLKERHPAVHIKEMKYVEI
jgi:hypothetical protein